MQDQKYKPVKILLVDDDEIDAEAVERSLEAERITNPIIRAKDGVDALEILTGSNGKEKIEGPFIILLDINMPRMSGLELLKELRANDDLKRSIVFVLTTSESQKDMFEAYNYNISGYLVKHKMGSMFKEMISLLKSYWTIVEFVDD